MRFSIFSGIPLRRRIASQARSATDRVFEYGALKTATACSVALIIDLICSDAEAPDGD